MKMDKVAGSGNDEFYSPRYAIKPIIKYLPSPYGFGGKSKIKIWCPFDTEESNFVKMFKEEGFDVIATHIKNGEDFFELDIECDYIISNPPYSLKNEVFERLFKLNKPFAMLVGVVGLFESKRRFEMFKDNNFEIMYLNKRVSYFKDYKEQKPSLNPPFSSVYLCSQVLRKNEFEDQIVFEEITKN
jgi:hypothetical protein